MLATYGTAALICVASALIGETVARASGHAPWRGWAPAVGFSLLLVVTAVALRSPGRDTTALVVVCVLCGGCALWLRRGLLARPSPVLVVAGLAVALGTAVPFLANARVGILGVSYNNDLAAHLPWTLSLLGDHRAHPPSAGYPLGPHSVAATFASLTGARLDLAFTALMVAVPLLSVPAALSVLEGLPAARRTVAAALVGLPYLMAAYYVQSDFKETIAGLLLLGFAAALRDLRRAGALAAALPLAVVAAGFLYDYSYGGLGWPLATVGLWAALELVVGGRPRPRGVLRRARAGLGLALPPALAGLAALAVLAAPEVPRILDLFRQLGASPAAAGTITGSNLGNLAGPVPTYEVFGLWPRQDFRFAPSPLYKYLVSAFGVLAALYGALWWLRRRDFALPAAVGAAALMVIYVRLGDQSPYIVAKTLAVGAPAVMALSVRPLAELVAPPLPRVVMAAAAVIFALVAAYSSFLALRGAQVGPSELSDELDSLRPLVRGSNTLFVGNDDFIPWELRGARVFAPAGTGQSGTGPQLPERPEKPWRYGEPVDLDSFIPRDLDRVRFAVVPRSAVISTPPPNFRVLRTTPSFVLFERRGPTPAYRVLAEGSAPGAVLRCGTPAGRRISRLGGAALVRPRPVVHRLRFDLEPGAAAIATLRLPPGRFELSPQYTSSQPLVVSTAAWRVRMPANLTRPGSFWRAGSVRSRGGALFVSARQLDRSALSSSAQLAQVTAVAAVRTGAPTRLVPLSRACSLYVDRYFPGSARPVG